MTQPLYVERNQSRLLQGVGVGLRDPHIDYILQTKPQIPWFEILIDNYLNKGGKVYQNLAAVAEHYPLSFHGVGMSLGSTDQLNLEYLQALKNLLDQFNPVHVSDHLCWTSSNRHYSHELLPLSYTPATIRHVVERIAQAQDYLGRRLLLENVSSYMSYQESVMSEWEFYCEIVEQADCWMLLDVNNIYVSAINHGFDPVDYLQAVPADRVKEIHLAGFEDMGDYLLDTHGAAINKKVWDLYRITIEQVGEVATLIEWDNNIPQFEVLVQEAQRAEKINQQVNCDVA